MNGLFLLSPVALDELHASLATLDLAHEAGVQAVVYLSAIHADVFTDPPHFAAKYAVERMIADLDVHATVLRPGVFMQNDLLVRDRLVTHGIWDFPVGNNSMMFVDVRDLAEVGARELERRLALPDAPSSTIDVVAPRVLSANRVAAMWSSVLGRDDRYAGDDLDQMEATFGRQLPSWFTYDMRLMYRRFQRHGVSTAPDTDDRLRTILGRPMRSYEDFIRETATSWGADRG